MHIPARYINPYTDFGFKKLFGEEASKNLLIDFLNSVLPESHQVADLTLQPTELLPDYLGDRKAIFDIACTSPHGEKFIVEMQKAKQRWFRDRALFYSSFIIQRQAQKGDWDFHLRPVFFVAVLDFEYDENEERREIQRMVSLKDQNGIEFSESLRMIFLQMPLFNKSESELQTKRDKWLYFLKNLESFEEIPSILREPVFAQAFEVAEWVNYPPALQEVYWASRKVYLDNVNTYRYAIESAEERGEARGEARGHARGRMETARNLKRLGIPWTTIAEATGLTEQEIERL